jgi:hypothetical protein
MKCLLLFVLAACTVRPERGREAAESKDLPSQTYHSGACSIEAPAGWIPGPLNVPWHDCLFELRPPEEKGHAILLMVDADSGNDLRSIFVLAGPGSDVDPVDEPVRTVGAAQCIVRRRPGTTHGHAVEVACIDPQTGAGAHLRATEPWAADHDFLAITARAASSFAR